MMAGNVNRDIPREALFTLSDITFNGDVHLNVNYNKLEKKERLFFKLHIQII